MPIAVPATPNANIASNAVVRRSPRKDPITVIDSNNEEQSEREQSSDDYSEDAVTVTSDSGFNMSVRPHKNKTAKTMVAQHRRWSW
ncbi:hypothetical protein CCUS01_05584 [Colletotrichum cuscutae]|uniref:Uncharacterized protein n=1 Tax=Colletotrichum cuscutae TaxID=1209917 RepID=A0AAI9Y1A5_9PEZI|nr:hypothetical protein CCUS01_05584 [Colletotrichum cuscutae]